MTTLNYREMVYCLLFSNNEVCAFDLQASPRMLPSFRPRTCSFITRLIGGDSQTLYRPITSPYTSRILKPFIRRDYESRPLKLQLLQQIIARGHRWIIFFACFPYGFVWLENSYGFWSTGTQCTLYSATTRTGPLGKESTNQNVTWEQRIAIFFRNKPITL